MKRTAVVHRVQRSMCNYIQENTTDKIIVELKTNPSANCAGVRRIYYIRFDISGSQLTYGASIWHQRCSSDEMLESQVKTKIAELRETATIRYEECPQSVGLPKYLTTGFKTFLVQTMRQHGVRYQPKSQNDRFVSMDSLLL